MFLVVSGKGGVGKSTVAANLAFALAMQKCKVGLIDADIFGPSIPIMYGIESQMPEVLDMGDHESYLPIKKFNVDLISIGNFIHPDQAIVWRGPLAAKSFIQIAQNTVWDNLDVLIMDMPPGTGDIHITAAQEFEIDGAIVVTTPQKVACADALKAGRMLQNENVNIKIAGVVENMAYFETEKLPDDRFYIFGKDGGQKLAESLNTSLIGQIPIVESICTSGDNGTPITNFDLPAIKSVYESIAKRLINDIEIK